MASLVNPVFQLLGDLHCGSESVNQGPSLVYVRGSGLFTLWARGAHYFDGCSLLQVARQELLQNERSPPWVPDSTVRMQRLHVKR